MHRIFTERINVIFENTSAGTKECFYSSACGCVCITYVSIVESERLSVQRKAGAQGRKDDDG